MSAIVTSCYEFPEPKVIVQIAYLTNEKLKCITFTMIEKQANLLVIPANVMLFILDKK